MTRTTPYSYRGLGRVPCKRCGGKSEFQWNICALGVSYYGICKECDIALNKLVLEFMRVPDWEKHAAEYERMVRKDT